MLIALLAGLFAGAMGWLLGRAFPPPPSVAALTDSEVKPADRILYTVMLWAGVFSPLFGYLLSYAAFEPHDVNSIMRAVAFAFLATGVIPALLARAGGRERFNVFLRYMLRKSNISAPALVATWLAVVGFLLVFSTFGTTDRSWPGVP